MRDRREVGSGSAYPFNTAVKVFLDFGRNGCEESVMLALSLRSIDSEEVVVMGRMEFTLYLSAGVSRADLSQYALGNISDRHYNGRGGLAEASGELQRQ
jgi:hypothetical protein